MKTIISAALLSIAGLALVVANKPAPPTHHIVASTSSAAYSIDMLRRSADTIAVVEATGKNNVHWNSRNNTAWTSDLPGRAMIYNDQEVSLVKLIRGDAPGVFTIRNIGGTVGDTEYELEGLEPLAAGSQYLVFLATFQTPTQDGFEAAVSFVGQNQGILLPTAAGFTNNVGLSTTAADLTR